MKGSKFNLMNNKILILIIYLNTYLIGAQTSMEAKKLLESVSKQIESYNNIKFEFNYVLNNLKEQINQESKGEVTVAGDLYKLDFLEATQLYDGKSLYTIIPENEEITITTSEEGGDFGINPTDLLHFYKEGYDYQWDIMQRIEGKKIQFIKLIPTEEDTEILSILMGIEVSKKHIFRIIEVGNNGTYTTLTINDMQVNTPLLKDYFVFDEKKYSDYYINY
jgi:outer membrane lipoprotein-sorting protein